MAQFFSVHPDNPQIRLVRQAAVIVRAGGVIVYPTDLTYAIACAPGNKDGVERMRRIRELGRDHTFTLVCQDLSELATYAHVDNSLFRLLKTHTPGPYTFLLNARHQVPRRLLHPKRRMIGLRIPDHPLVRALLAELGGPLISSTLILPGETLPLTDPEDIREHLEHQVDLIIDSGGCGLEVTTVVDLTGPEPILVRCGRGALATLMPDASD